MKKMKDKTFISRMVKTLTKLETKYLTPRPKRKRQPFIRKLKNGPKIPIEIASNYYVLTAPEPKKLTVLKPFPQVRQSNVRIKPAFPNPESCPVHTCFPDHEFHVDRYGPSFHSKHNTSQLQSVAKNLVKCAYTNKPDVSSDSSQLQSKYERISEP